MYRYFNLPNKLNTNDKKKHQSCSSLLDVSLISSPRSLGNYNNKMELSIMDHAGLFHDRSFEPYLKTLETLKARVKSNPRIIHEEDTDGHTLLALACSMERLEMVRFLLSVGANPNLVGRSRLQTPLMIACNRGYKDITQTLLENRANVMIKCETYERTALHYVCLKDNEYEKNKPELRIQCIQLLLEHGAKYQEDSLGMTPMCYAALSRMDEELLDAFQGNKDFVLSNMEKVKILKLRGVLYVIWDRQEMIDRAFDSFLESKQLELKYGQLPESSLSKFLCHCLGREECKTVTELEKLKGNKDAIVIEGFLTGQRIIPMRIAPEYLWQPMLDYANDKLCEGEEFNLCQRIVRFIIVVHFERYKDLDRVDVLECLSNFCEGEDLTVCQRVVQTLFGGYLPRNSRLPPVYTLRGLGSAMITAGGVVDSVSFMSFLLDSVSIYIEKLNMEGCGRTWVDKMCRTAYLLSFYQDDDKFHSVLPQIDAMFRKMYRMLKIDTRQQNYKVCATTSFLGIMLDKYSRRPRMLTVKAKENLKRVLLGLLQLDNAAYYTPGSAYTMLHLMAGKLLYDSKDRREDDFIVTITEIIIRNGSPINAQNDNGLTAKEYFLKYKYNAATEDTTAQSRWLALLSPESAPSLQELAARTVLKWKIPYADVLPAPLQKFLE